MLAFLDAGVNVKGGPNENLARANMEMFTLGEGHYGESDIREAARAFTGWNARGLVFAIDPTHHGDGVKRVLGREGRLNGINVIDTLLAQPVVAEHIAGKLYQYFVRQDLSPALRRGLAAALRRSAYDIATLLETIFLSRDFHAPASVATRIRPPVELVVSTYRLAGLLQIPGVPDFNAVTESLGQKLFYPPTVAGWAQGRSWITPGLLIARSNFAYDLICPDINFIPPDRYPSGEFKIGELGDKLAQGLDVNSANRLDGMQMRSTSLQLADRDEEFNTRLASYRGWQMAVRARRHLPLTYDDPRRFGRKGLFEQRSVLDAAPDVQASATATANPSLGFMRDVAQSARDSATRVREAWAHDKTPVDYGIVPLALPKIAALIHAGLPTRLYYSAYRHNAFDTHAQQADRTSAC